MRDFLDVPFNRPLFLGRERYLIDRVLAGNAPSVHGPLTKLCEQWLAEHAGSPCALMTSSCTHALEMAALLIDVGAGDEVIMPSWTFVSTANAFVLRGARPVFVDICPDTGNLDESLLEAAITPKTRAIVVVHYGGVSCEMTEIMAIAHQYGLWVIEDAAHALMSVFKERPVGGIGHLAAYSFHATKNFTSGGQGGALLVNHAALIERATIIRDMGTNRDAFIKGGERRYQWVDIGSSYFPTELQAAYLSAQLEMAHEVIQKRKNLWDRYYNELRTICCDRGAFLPLIPPEVEHNAHLFFIRIKTRDRILHKLNAAGVMAQTHYEPLHLSPAGRRYGRFSGEDRHTLGMSSTIIRLPIYYAMTEDEQAYVIAQVRDALA